MSRVLVTGATGFVGLPVVTALAAAGHEVHALSRRPGDLDGVSWHQADLLAGAELVDSIAPEILVHLAWYAEHGRFWQAPENLQWVEASLRLLGAFARAGGRRAVVAGTCAEYLWGGDEDLLERDSPLVPGTLYGVCKDALRRIAEGYAAQLGSLEIAWARLFFMYGPREAPGRLVPSVVRPLLAGERAPATSGEQVRDFMHIDDVAAALSAVAASEVTGAVNIASGEGVAVREVVELIGELTGAPQLLERGALPTRAAEPARIVGSAERLGLEVGFSPRVALRDGLAGTIEWWRHAPSPAAG